MAEKVHAFDAPCSCRKFVFAAAAHDWVLVVGAHCRHIHHGGYHEIWRESADTTLLKKKPKTKQNNKNKIGEKRLK